MAMDVGMFMPLEPAKQTGPLISLFELSSKIFSGSSITLEHLPTCLNHHKCVE